MKGYTIGIYEKAILEGLNWKEKLEAARDAGYDFMEISIDETNQKLARLEMGQKERLEIVRTMYETGLPIRSMCLSGHRRYPMGSSNPVIEKRSMDIVEKAIQLADDLGIRIIMLAGYDVYYEDSSGETKERFHGNLMKAVDLAARSGIILAFETMETEFMNTVGKAVRCVREINSPYLQVYPDIGNITNAAVSYGLDVLDDLKDGRGSLVAMHLKETAPGIFRDMMYGEGHVDFEKAVKTAWGMGIRRYVAEFWYQGSDDWRKDLIKVHNSMACILDAQG